MTAAAAHWDALAAEQERHPLRGPAHAHRAALYRRTAEALRLEAAAGTPLCSCHLRPFPTPQEGR